MSSPSASPPVDGFLCGSDMNPQRILAQPETTNARFEGIGCVPVALAGQAGLPPGLAEHGTGIWGIVVSGVDVSAWGGEGRIEVEVRQRGDRCRSCVLLTTPATVGALAGVVSETWYWELPLLYREALAAVAGESPVLTRPQAPLS